MTNSGSLAVGGSIAIYLNTFMSFSMVQYIIEHI